MPRNRSVFEEAMKKAHSLAWDARWEEAAQEYARALAEFPTDLTARLNLGLAYLQLGRLQEALAEYQQAGEIAPADPLPLEKTAHIQEQLGERKAAAQSYARLAQVWSEARSPARALFAWQKAVSLAPDDPLAREQLARSYEYSSQPDEAVQEYLAAARICQETGDVERAIQYCDSALVLNPYSDDARKLRETLSVSKALQRARSEMVKPDSEGSLLSAATRQALGRLAALAFEEHAEPSLPSDLAAFERSGAPGVAVRDAERGQIGTFIGRAIDYQMRGVLDQAIAAYQQAIALGADYPEVYFNLGVLCFKVLDYDQAIEHLQQVGENPLYGLVSHFALGQCYRAQGRLREALEHYLKLLRALGLQKGKASADDLLQLYTSLTGSRGRIEDRERAATFIDAITHLLSGKGWQGRLLRLREQIENLATSDAMVSLTEIVQVPGSEQVLEGLRRSQEYLAHGLFMAAIEECYWILELAPTYLPIHMHLAEIFVRQGKIDQAIAKYTAIANHFQIRGDTAQAINTYRRVIELNPLDTAMRPRLISLLTSRGQIDEALGEYMILAEVYYEAAQFDAMLTKLGEALALAPRGSSERNWPAVIRKRMAEIHMQRLNWDQAAALYREMKQAGPLDDEERYTLVELYYRTGKNAQAEAEIDEWLSDLRQAGQAEKALAILQRLRDARPELPSLRMRMARLLLQTGRKEEAVTELDSLGEYQLEQGQVREAIKTINQIIALRPRQVAAYQELLAQLEAQAGEGGVRA